MIILAKKTKRLNIKGDIDYKNQTITEYDKDVGEIVHKFEDIFVEFDGLENTTLTLAYDEVIVPE